VEFLDKDATRLVDLQNKVSPKVPLALDSMRPREGVKANIKKKRID
jgi:hypothetical protein